MARDESRMARRAVTIILQIARRYGLDVGQHPQLSELMAIIVELRERCREKPEPDEPTEGR